MQLIHGDCLEKMKDIPDGSIDMILCDLPYGTTACKWDTVIPFNKYVQIGEKVIYEQEYVFDKMKSGVSYKEALEDFLSISKDGLWDNYNRIIKDRGAIVLFGSQPFTSALVMSNPKRFKCQWVWKKRKAGNFQLAKHQPLKITEEICVFGKNRVNYYPIPSEISESTKNRYKYKGGGAVANLEHMSSKEYAHQYNFGKEHGYPKNILEFGQEVNSFHPTQKPVALLEYLIKTYTLEGETVLDNCMGSGSTGVACINTKRNFIGIEKDDRYFEIAKKRIEEHLTTAST